MPVRPYTSLMFMLQQVARDLDGRGKAKRRVLTAPDVVGLRVEGETWRTVQTDLLRDEDDELIDGMFEELWVRQEVARRLEAGDTFGGVVKRNVAFHPPEGRTRFEREDVV